jgi:hypothetical protein
MSNFADDIPLSVAISAHNGTSHVPEQRGAYEQRSYAESLQQDYDNLTKVIVNKPEMAAVLEEEFARYRDGIKKRTLAYLWSRSRVVSTFIAGGSNFPVRRMEKRQGYVEKRLNELIDFRARALAAIRKTLCPELRPIMLGDANAGERLQDKIAKAEAFQNQMKACNLAIRKNAKVGAEAQVAALIALGINESRAHMLLKPDFCGRIGFADYELTNNNANIRRMKGRLANVERAQSQPATETEGANARFEDSPSENRVRLFFPSIPAAEIRSTLKGAAFRWTPSLGCWQAYRNERTITLAKQIAG